MIFSVISCCEYFDWNLNEFLVRRSGIRDLDIILQPYG